MFLVVCMRNQLNTRKLNGGGGRKDKEKWLVKYAENKCFLYLENSNLGASLLASEMLYYTDMKGNAMKSIEYLFQIINRKQSILH